MSTAKQVQANRENAKNSTGPKTPEGKNKVSQNAVTHGLTSHRPVLDMEDTAEFRTFVNELLDQLDPTNPWEFVFAKRASCQAWRIQRAQSYETLVLDKLIKSASQTDKTKTMSDTKADPGISPNDFRPPKTKITDYIDVDPGLLSEDDPKSLLGQALMDDFRYHWTLDKLARYETRLENSMIRCLNKFQKVRESKMMNFSSLRQYYRDFQPRPQDFMDNTAPNKPNDQPKSPPAKDEPDQNENEQNKPNPYPDRVRRCQLHQDRSLDAGLLQDPSAQPSQDMPIDSFTSWRQLYCEPRGYHHNYDDSNDVPEVPHRPDVPEKGEYIYRKNWQHRFLDMVNYPSEKRRILTEPELTELVDPILRGFPNPIQVLWDFGLIELTAEAVAKRYPKTKAV